MYAVETCEHHRRKREVRVAGRVGRAELQALQLRGGGEHRDADRRRAVARGVAEVYFALAGGGDLVVVALDRDARLLQLAGDLAAEVLQRVERRQRDVALLVAYVVAEV